MTIRSIDYLKTKFATGETPVQADFYDLLETMCALGDTLGAYSILKRDATSSPAEALTIPASSIVGRKSTGGVVALSMSDAQALLGTGLPTAAVIPYAGGAAPDGFLLCDGSPVSRTTYAALYAITGDAFGAGNGTTTFNLPDMRGAFPIGVTTGKALGDSGGSLSVNIDHHHDVTPNTIFVHPGSDTNLNVAAPGSVPTTDAGGDIDITPPYLALNYIIKI